MDQENNQSADSGVPPPADDAGPSTPGAGGRGNRRPYRRRPRRPHRAIAEAAAPQEPADEPAIEELPPPEEPAPAAPRRGGRGRGRGKAAPPPVAEDSPPAEVPEPPAAEPLAASELPVSDTAAPDAGDTGEGAPSAAPARPRSRARGSRGRGRGRGRAGAEPPPLEAAGAGAEVETEPLAALDPAFAGLPAPPAAEALGQELADFLAARPPADDAGEPISRGVDWVTDQETAPLPEIEPPAPPAFALDEALPPGELGKAEAPARRRAPRKQPSRGDRARPAAAKEARPERAQPARSAERAPREREEHAPREREERAPRERLHKEILVNVDDRETRIAVIEEGRLVELHVEREERVVGSIYKGRVCNVLPGMDAAFVDVGLERNAFLYVGDILFDTGDSGSRRTSREARIKDIAKPGQELLVQVVKGPRGTKGARVSTRMSIPGRFLVLMPEGDHLGVSRKIEDGAERDRLRKIGEALRPSGFGLIVRTEAEEMSEADLRQDLDMLVKLWRQITDKAKRTPAPALIHQDLSLILKTIRDMFGSDVERMVLDSESEYQKALDMLEVLSPALRSRVQLHQDSTPLFSRYNIEEEIDRLLRRKVWLKSGGYLTIDSTEALTTIDVNTGKYIGTTSLSDTIVKTNLDAVDEIARQLRLRDVGGMIVIDFIDMSSARDRQQVMRALETAFKRDRTRTKIAHISPLGLVEMTRKRTAEAVTDVMTEPCPYCQGRGRVWSPQTMAIQIEREIKRRCAQADLEAVLIHAHPQVAAWLIGPEGENVEELEREIRRPIYVRARHQFHVEQYEVLPGDMLEIEDEMLPFHGGQVVDCLVSKMELIVPPRSAGWVDGYFVDLANGTRFDGQTTRVRLVDVRRSFALAEPVAPAASVDRSEPI